MIASNHSKYKPVDGTILRWDLTVDQLFERTKNLINKSRAVYDNLAGLVDEDLNYDSVIKALADDDCEFSTNQSLVDFPQYVSCDKAIREASTKCDKLISAYQVERGMRVDVYEKVHTFSLKVKESGKLKGEAKRYLERILRDYRRNGLHLDSAARAHITEIKNKINELAIDFSKNLNDVVTKLQFTANELEGMPADFIESLTEVKGTDPQAYEVTLSYPHVFSVMKKCSVAASRQKLNIAFNSRCLKVNTDILEELVSLRDQLAKILGYATHAEYITEIRMSGGTEPVHKFLTDLESKLSLLAQNEMSMLLELKEKEMNERVEKFDAQINAYVNVLYVQVS
eukprot:CFRG3374T1